MKKLMLMVHVFHSAVLHREATRCAGIGIIDGEQRQSRNLAFSPV